jgi:hypothetical protein
MSQHSPMSLACFAAAGAWPTIVTALESALMPPYEQILRVSICGAPLHASPEFLGHCAACWAGSAILAATGILVFMSKPDRRAIATVRAD